MVVQEFRPFRSHTWSGGQKRLHPVEGVWDGPEGGTGFQEACVSLILFQNNGIAFSNTLKRLQSFSMLQHHLWEKFMTQIPRSHILTQDLDEETRYASLTCNERHFPCRWHGQCLEIKLLRFRKGMCLTGLWLLRVETIVGTLGI